MDSAGVEKIADKYLNSLYRVAVNYCKNAENAGDAVQNAFLKLMKSDMSFNDEEHVYKWLIKVTINECKNFWRVFRLHPTVSFDELEDENSPDNLEDGSAVNMVLAHELRDAVMRLPAKYSVVIHLFYYDGYSVDEIAEILNLSSSAVKMRLMRGKQKLKNEIDEGD